MANKIDDAGLNDRWRKNGVGRLGKPLQSVDDGDRMSPTPRFLNSFMTFSQNLAPSVFFNP